MVQRRRGSLFKSRIYLPYFMERQCAHEIHPGQPQKSHFIVTLAVPACPVALCLREWGRSTLSAEFVMRLLKRAPRGPVIC